jgi:hypothetical protein
MMFDDAREKKLVRVGIQQQQQQRRRRRVWRRPGNRIIDEFDSGISRRSLIFFLVVLRCEPDNHCRPRTSADRVIFHL